MVEVGSLWALSPLGRMGCRYALIPERVLRSVSAGELVILALVASCWRPRGAVQVSFRVIGQASGFCSRTAGAHVASLRLRGFIQPDVLALAPKALTQPLERFVRVPVDKVGRTSPAAFRVAAFSLLWTDRQGRRRVSWRWLAERLGVSRRTVTANVAKLRAAGWKLASIVFRHAAKTFPSSRKDLAHHSRKRVSKGDTHRTATAISTMTAPAFEAERSRQLSIVGALLRDPAQTRLAL